jgi:hypothetical protein
MYSALAYFASLLVTKEKKVFITLTPGVMTGAGLVTGISYHIPSTYRVVLGTHNQIRNIIFLVKVSFIHPF